MGLQFNTVTAKKTDLSNDALLDCGATFSSFKNENLVRDIETVDTPRRMRTNVGTRKINQEVELLKNCKVYRLRGKLIVISIGILPPVTTEKKLMKFN